MNPLETRPHPARNRREFQAWVFGDRMPSGEYQLDSVLLTPVNERFVETLRGKPVVTNPGHCPGLEIGNSVVGSPPYLAQRVSRPRQFATPSEDRRLFPDRVVTARASTRRSIRHPRWDDRTCRLSPSDYFGPPAPAFRHVWISTRAVRLTFREVRACSSTNTTRLTV